MSTLKPNPADTHLFNSSTHHYTLHVDAENIKVGTNDESRGFNALIEFNSDEVRRIDDESITAIGCFGNQHPNAVVRDMMRVPKWDSQTLREYSMFTIGDILITTKDTVYFSVNGDLQVVKRENGFSLGKGVA